MHAQPENFALIIGAMKSGTTTLFDLLAQHPQIAASSTKEPNFFSHQQDPRASWDSYLALWNWSPGRHRVALEASVAYAKAPWVPDVPRRISLVSNATVKFIYVLRHPLRRIESQVRHAIFAGWGQPLDKSGLTRDLIDFSSYGMQIKEYRKYFPADCMHIVALEDLESAPEETLRSCCRFLGVDESFEFRGASQRKNVGDLYTVPPSVRDVVQNGMMRTIAQAILPRRAYARVREFVGKQLGGREAIGRWQLNPDEQRYVVAELADDLRFLNTDVGIDTQRLWGLPVPGSRR